MPTIRQLPPDVVNKIAAGEVIERPASVVKELMENSIDAGAGRVDVSLEQGGMQMVRVADDGCGISPEQMPLAVASHATSKISDADDLFHVTTLGFRGEALASIGAVSRLRIRARTADSESGAELEMTGGRQADVVPCGCPVGTTIEVRDLFYNTPVRRKFMRTTQTEMGHASEAFTRIALAHPEVHLTLRHNQRTLHDLPPCDRWKDRVAALFGEELAEGLIWVESQDEHARIRGYVADPQFSRAANRMQYLFLNGRHIRDRSLQHALGEAYRGLLLTGRYPIVFLRLDLAPDAVDVNVHPTKLEVRFVDSGRLYSQLLGAIRGKFLATDLTARVGSPERPEAGREPASGFAGDESSAHDPAEARRHREELVRWAQGELPQAGGDSSGGRNWDASRPAAGGSGAAWSRPTSGTDGRNSARFEQRPAEFGAERGRGDAWFPADNGRPGGGMPTDPGGSGREVSGEALERDRPAAFGPGYRGMQLQNRYLVTEDERGIVVIDQHALHERVLYEQLREKVLAGQLETQRLLVPETVSLSPSEAAAVLEARDTLAQLGLSVEPFGGDTVVVSSYPAMLSNISPAELLRQLVDQLLDGGQTPDRRDVLDELLHMMSCKAAVKAGDRLTLEEVTALLEQRHLCQDAHHCPHGRPTALVFTREELDKRFRRI